MGDIFVLKMVSGEEVIAEIDSGPAGVGQLNYEKYKRPRVLQIQETGRGLGAALVPWVLSDPDATMQVKNAAVAAICEAPKGVADSYRQAVSGIQLTQSLQG